MMTGKLTFPYRGWTPLPPDETILSELMTAAGYVTMLICDTPHLVRDGHRFDRGFSGWEWLRGQEGDRAITDDVPVRLQSTKDKVRNPESMREHHYRWRAAHWKNERDTFVARTMQRATDWLEANHTHERFFLYVDTFDPHEPWDPPQHYVDIYDPGYKGQVIDHPRYDYCDYLSPEEIRHTRALYAGEVTMVDTWVGQLLAKVERLGLYENTAVIFMSDHGHYIGDHGRIGKSGQGPDGAWPFYEEVSHPVLMGYVPGSKAQGTRTKVLTQPVDFMQTVLDLAGVKVPPGRHGISMAPVLRGGKPRATRKVAVTSEALRVNDERSVCSSITDGNWTLHYRGPNWPAELYDLRKDPAQKRNVFRRNAEVARRLHRGYLDVLRRAGTSEEKLSLRLDLP
jgi:arylsulfatase A-like enzyme